MAAPIGSLVIDLDANTATFTRDMGKAERAVNQSTKRMDRDFARTKKSIGTFQAAFSVAAVAGVAMFYKRSLSLTQSLADTAAKLGLTTERLQELRYAFEQNGVASNTTDMALQRFTRRLAEAQQGAGELKDTLKQYGIAVRDMDGHARSPDAVFRDLADAIKNARTHQERLRIAFKAFDSEGAAFVTLMGQGREGLKKFSDEARSLGIVLEDDLVRRSVQANSELLRMEKIISVNLTRALDVFTPKLTEMTSKMVKSSDAASKFFGVDKASKIAEHRVEIKRLNEAIGIHTAALYDAQTGWSFFSKETLQARLDNAKTRLDEVTKALARLNGEATKPKGVQVDIKTPRSVTYKKDFDEQLKAYEKYVEGVRARSKNLEVALRTPWEAYRAELREIDEIRKRFWSKSKDGAETHNRALEAARERWIELETATDAAGDATDRFNDKTKSMEDSFVDAMKRMKEEAYDFSTLSKNAMYSFADGGANAMVEFRKTGKLNFKDLAASVADDIIRMTARMAIFQAMSSAFGAFGGGTANVAFTGAGQAGSVIVDGATTGFASGGAIMPGGSGGTDSQRVVFNKSPDERVDIRTPAQVRADSRGGGGDTINNYNNSFHFDGSPDQNAQPESLSRISRQLGRVIDRQKARGRG